MTKKELIEGGWIEKYILGLTSESESEDVERLANIYPDVQSEINRSRSRICGQFNRNLTQPALRHSFLTKRRVLYGSAFAIVILLTGLAFLYKAHCTLQDNYNQQAQLLAEDEEKLFRMTSFSKTASEQSQFLHAPHTKRILMKGCSYTPDAEVMVFQCRMSGRMIMQVIDLPLLKEGQYYEVWAQAADDKEELLGKIMPPIRFDSLYDLDSTLYFKTLSIAAIDSATNQSESICMAMSNK